ncbi:MAG: hypothetical protein OHK0013_28280 [Sandaracinaceae bacterium]
MVGRVTGALFLLFSIWLVGCDAGAPRCIPGSAVGCACVDGAPGGQVCNASGAFDPCVCGARCRPGQLFACLCDDGGSGTQRCLEDGTLEECSCRARCVPGAESGCLCPSGLLGSQRCTEDGRYGACVCLAGCIEGQMISCTCADGVPSSQTCTGGRLAPCECGVPDAGIPDGAVPACPACGCGSPPEAPEPLPVRPPVGLLRDDQGEPIDLFVVERGYVVVSTVGAHLVGRDGTTLATYRSERVVESAVADGDHVVLFDRAVLTVLDHRLDVLRSVPLFERCAATTMLPCGRAACRGDVGFVVYDVVRGSSVPSFGAGFGSPRSDLLPIRGRDLIVDAPPFVLAGFFGVDLEDRVSTRGRYVGVDFHPVTTLGWPSHTVLLSDGAMRGLATCGELWLGGPPPGCLEPAGDLGVVRSGESILEADFGVDGRLYALISGSGGDRIARVDVEGRREISSAALDRDAWTGTSSGLWLRHDAWGGRVAILRRYCPTGRCVSRTSLVAYDAP